MSPIGRLYFCPPSEQPHSAQRTEHHGYRLPPGPKSGNPHPERISAKTTPWPPHDHYSTDSGEWDGQLPHSDIADQSNDPAQYQSPNWPTLLERMLWTRAIIRAYKLPPPQAAVLNEIAFRDGRGRGCTATMETLALDTGYNEKSIRRATQALEQKNIIIAQGNPGQKKIMVLPVKDGQLPWPTPVRESGVSAHDNPQPRSESPGFDQQRELQPRSQSPGLTPTPVRESGVAPAANPEHQPEPPRQQPTSVTESEVTDQRPNHELERIRALVVQNWPMLEKNGWEFLEAAIKHYKTYGITYLQRDLRVKQENLQRQEQATRTCGHCNTVHESTDQLRECAMCHKPKCVSEMNPCHRDGCDGKQASRSRSRPQSRQRQ